MIRFALLACVVGCGPLSGINDFGLGAGAGDSSGGNGGGGGHDGGGGNNGGGGSGGDGPGGMGGAMPCVDASEDFDGGIDMVQWNDNSTDGGSVMVDGMGRMVSVVPTVPYAQGLIESRQQARFGSCALIVELVEAANVPAQAYAVFAASPDPAHAVGLQVENGLLFSYIVDPMITGPDRWIAASLDLDQHRWWALRFTEGSNEVVFETSGDGVAWEPFDRRQVSFRNEALGVFVGVIGFNSGGEALFDNVNRPP